MTESFYIGPSGFPVGGYCTYFDAECTKHLRHPRDTTYGTLPKRHHSVAKAREYGLKALYALTRAERSATVRK